jgi:hypothetical protein
MLSGKLGTRINYSSSSMRLAILRDTQQFAGVLHDSWYPVAGTQLAHVMPIL